MQRIWGGLQNRLHPEKTEKTKSYNMGRAGALGAQRCPKSICVLKPNPTKSPPSELRTASGYSLSQTHLHLPSPRIRGVFPGFEEYFQDLRGISRIFPGFEWYFQDLRGISRIFPGFERYFQDLRGISMI